MKKILFLSMLAAASFGVVAQQPNPLTITENTKFVSLPADCYWISDLEDGAWTVKHNNDYGFFLEDGRCLFGFEWAINGSRNPQMLEGAVIMYKKGANYNKPQYLLKINGSVKELSADLTGPATNFIDGVALIGKKKGFEQEYIYVNTNGERVYGDLTSMPDRFDRKDWTVPPLREGLRAWKDAKSQGFTKKWGFIDDKGKVVIPAKFDKVRSFSEGYALVKEGDKIYFIDKKGNKAFEPTWGGWDVYFDRISDVSDGLFVVDGSPRVYYNMKGEKVKEVEGGTMFRNGYAFCHDGGSWSKTSLVIDRDFKTIRTIDNVGINWDDFGNCPEFNANGIATVKHERVIKPDGTVLIQHYSANGENVRDYGIENVTNSGYAKAWLNHNDVRYKGFINMEGEFVIVYDWDKSVTQISADPRNPNTKPPIKPRKPDQDPRLGPYPIPIKPEDGTPIGPRTVTNALYSVAVTAMPAEGGKVSGSGKYKLGDKVTLSATPNEGWRLDKWECTTQGFYSKAPGDITIDGRNLEFVATFKKKPEKDEVEGIGNTGCYSAHQTAIIDKDGGQFEFDVYMEMDANKGIESPYGKKTYGYLTCMIDAEKPIVVPQKVNGKSSSFSLNAFFVPMKIDGITKDPDGKRYMMLDGGQLLVSNIHMGDNSGLAGLYVMFIMEMNGGTFGTASTAKYKLELTEYNEKTGECTFGELYRFHPELGWVLSEKYPTKRSKGFMSTKKEDTSVNGDFFKGLKMKSSGKRKVDFVPPKSWRESDYEKYAAEYLKSLSETKTDWDTYFSTK